MKESYIKKLIRILEDSKIDTIQISSLWGFNKIKLSKSATLPVETKTSKKGSSAIEIPTIPDFEENEKESPGLNREEKTPVITENLEGISENDNIHHITAPLVGTFYSTPNPETPPFIKKGDKIQSGQTICIIEAMKIFNEIESDVSGTIHEILIDNASPVEYGQKIISVVLDD